ncbi:hypothetical protein ASPACDRAFT_41535 [Aspergillus aculeatus ATCC 16872]|uniref:Uncharacterized protein n=1 Tax=Aspergillus aculeatus (strain ATCC 16872 / CBS 172.66 / WB 5094) TaxID=690307 RepID=A0A1L9WYI9_ASPA1|nr:uncharacterized protein ASPACDRAFT_41535 [Aspergillus aculeatus ATCC 16872]OJK01271.1 hypothetical protein ASPACDRAFT_41535 [Aspergillus aculeatus ATCC 16872]
MALPGAQIGLDEFHRSDPHRLQVRHSEDQRLLPSGGEVTPSRPSSTSTVNRSSTRQSLRSNTANGRDGDSSSGGGPSQASQPATTEPAASLLLKKRKCWRWRHLFVNPGTNEAYELHDDGATLTRIVFLRVMALFILITAIVLGAIGKSYDIASLTVGNGILVDEDAQLAAIGVINSILQLLTQGALQHSFTTLVTRWMTGKGQKGASLLDFELYEEHQIPWAAISAFKKRCELGVRKRIAWLRFGGALAVGICLFLLGAAMNTIAIPKSRWWPDTRYVVPDPPDDRFYFTNQTSQIASVSRMSLWGKAWDMVRIGGPVSWEMAHSLAAYHSLQALGLLYNTFNNAPGWRSLGDNDVPAFSAIRIPESSAVIQSMAVHGDLAIQMYEAQKAHSKHSWARYSTGWNALLLIPGVLLTTSCTDHSNSSSSSSSSSSAGAWEATSNSNATITLIIGPVTNITNDNSTNTFPGATCQLQVQQAQIPLGQWLYSGTSNYAYAIDYGENNPNPALALLPKNSTSQADASIAAETTSWFTAILPNLQSFTSDPALLNLTSLALTLADDLVSLNRGYTRLDGVAAVVATVFTDMITSFDWTYSAVLQEATSEAASGSNGTVQTTLQGPVRWQLYGSGPRLPWEWTIAIVLAVAVGVHVVDLGVVVWSRGLREGFWLSLAGMMAVAGATRGTPTSSSADDAGVATEGPTETRFIIREEKPDTLEGQAGEGEEGKVVLLKAGEDDDEDRYAVMRPGRKYRGVG